MMSMFFSRIRHFLTDQDAAVTVDWVVLTASVVGLGLTSAVAVRTGTSTLGSDIQSGLGAASVASLANMDYHGPWIEASGRGSAYSSYQCARGGGCWTTNYIDMSYQMDDGNWWQMRSVQTDDEEPVVTWYDHNGDIVEIPPRFRES